MYLKKLEDLSRFLVTNESTSDEICRFLNFETFNYLESRAILFAQLTNDGSLTPTADFGFTTGAVASWGKFPLTFDMPITSAVRKNICVHINSPKDLFVKYPGMKDIPNLDQDWNSILAIPVHAYGVFSITSYQQPVMDDDHDGFLRTVGQLATVGMTKVKLAGLIKNRGARAMQNSRGLELTPRQELIKKLVLQGMTNQQIAIEIGFSDSLVRQETMAIYAALNVSGRKELLENSGGGG
jgi:DNA-binding CsgD family transcriptional regulator